MNNICFLTVGWYNIFTIIERECKITKVPTADEFLINKLRNSDLNDLMLIFNGQLYLKTVRLI